MIAELILAMAALVPTDQTVNVAKGTKLDLNNFAGDVNVKVWDRDAVRVEATHSDRETVDIKQGEQVLTVRSRSTRGGPPRSLDYTITVPKWMAITVGGNYADVNMDGVGGDVTVDTQRGDIKVVGGSGFVSLKSIQGLITLEKAKGRVEVRAINEGIHLADISADLSAESTNGSIILDRIDSSNVDLYTVNGNISYDGPIKDKGLYRLTTHNGLIAMPVPDKANATLTLRTYNGGIRSTFQLPGDSADRRKRMTLTLGNGSAHVELESFGGTISLRRPGEPRPETERRRREKDKDIGALAIGGLGVGVGRGIGVGIGRGLGSTVDQAEIDRAVQDAMAEAQPEIERALAEAQPEIDRAVAEAMREVGPELERMLDDAASVLNSVVVPHVNVVPTPTPRPNPKPQPRIR
jgi:putative adhesin